MGSQINEFGQPIGSPLRAALPDAPPTTSPMSGDWCTVRPIDIAADGPALFAEFAAASDDREWTYLPYGPFEDAARFGRWLEWAAAQTDTLFFTIHDGDGPCGVASYLRIAPSAGSVEVGHIHFGPRLQRSRAATEAMVLMMSRAFDAGYRRYEWKCDALNAGSRAAAQRLGFTFEGVFRQATTYKGRNRDTAWFSIIDAEWPTRRIEFDRWLDPTNFDSAGNQLTSLRHER